MTADGTPVGELSGAAAPAVRHARVPAVRARRPVWPAGSGSRRPSGRERDVPRVVSRSVWAYGAAFAGAVALLVLWSGRPGGLPALDRAVHDLLAPAGAPPAWAADLGRVGVLLGYPVLWVPVVAVLVWTARWRHLLVYAGSISAVAAAAQLATGESDLHRLLREGVTGSPGELSLTAWPVIVLSTVATADLLVLTPSGRLRRCGWAVVVLVVGGLAAVRVALGVDTASNAVVGAALGCGAAGLLFGLLAPEDRFPVTLRRADKAHLELDDDRSARVLRAVRDQLGIEVAAIEPYRLDGSAGSTPCRLRLAAGPPEHLFGKLCATPHLRSDRWYKLARVLRYGRLEDEAPFATVRQLVQHEDYMLRLMRDGGVQVPEPVGVVEVQPGREYLLVTELVPDAVEVLESGVPDAVVDDALRQVRRLWAAGVAHRDLKPSNVLVQGDRVVLVDVSFGELRPTRWRQAADLANVLLTLALVAGAPRVLERALAFFDRDELAEAFAATGSLTVPTQLARRLDEADGDLLEEFRSLLPPAPRIRVQRWSPRRALLTLATVGGAVLAVVLLALNLRAGGLL
ncbi:RIO1 family regulatory kinase/ATPase [Geodermatophilus sp. SYSU D00965]